jgi:hypothetical protein
MNINMARTMNLNMILTMIMDVNVMSDIADVFFDVILLRSSIAWTMQPGSEGYRVEYRQE